MTHLRLEEKKTFLKIIISSFRSFFCCRCRFASKAVFLSFYSFILVFQFNHLFSLFHISSIIIHTQNPVWYASVLQRTRKVHSPILATTLLYILVTFPHLGFKLFTFGSGNRWTLLANALAALLNMLDQQSGHLKRAVCCLPVFNRNLAYFFCYST